MEQIPLVSGKMPFKFAFIIAHVSELREVLLDLKVGETCMQISSPTLMYLWAQSSWPFPTALVLLTDKETEMQ